MIDYMVENVEDELGVYKYVIDVVGNVKLLILKEWSKKVFMLEGKYIFIDYGIFIILKEVFLNLKILIEEEKIKFIIDCIYFLEEMAEVYKYVEMGYK